ncbi:FAD-binding domain-containing protein [Haloarcula japonica]|uniref:FAD-binding domain-containing protein n=1 Tax=Haloarcula japonica TaxID=29282 RepID=UPI0039F6C1A7
MAGLELGSTLDAPQQDVIPTLADDEAGTVVWHREHLRIRDQAAVARAAASEYVLPLFVFDPVFYGADGLACDSRIRFLHDCLADLSDQYHTVTGRGLTYAHGDPVDVLRRFREAGWDIVTMAVPTGRYGQERDRRVQEQCGVTFIDGDGLIRDRTETREGWQDDVSAWFSADQYDWNPRTVVSRSFDSGTDIDVIEDHYDVTPSKSDVPRGGTGPARERLSAFAERIDDYPGNISAPTDARDGTSGLSPYLAFGCLSVRQVIQYIDEHVPDGRGKEMFVSRLFWNKHYEQKLEDWSGWLDTAVNPVFEGFNAEQYDPDLVDAWKHGRTGFPMVDASMRCLKQTGWLNFRMRAMCASVYYHLLQQPWRIGADWFYHHLIDASAAINYTQWQSQCGLVGKPTLRLYNPRKQVRDQDPDGEFIRRWVPELDSLPDEHLARPEQTPVHVQASCGVDIGETYPYPVVDYDAARQAFRRRYEAVRADAADALCDPAIARRASFSGGRDAAVRIATEHGTDASNSEANAGTQTSLGSFGDE